MSPLLDLIPFRERLFLSAKCAESEAIHQLQRLCRQMKVVCCSLLYFLISREAVHQRTLITSYLGAAADTIFNKKPIISSADLDLTEILSGKRVSQVRHSNVFLECGFTPLMCTEWLTCKFFVHITKISSLPSLDAYKTQTILGAAEGVNHAQ